jgi:hypothetical protein
VSNGIHPFIFKARKEYQDAFKDNPDAMSHMVPANIQAFKKNCHPPESNWGLAPGDFSILLTIKDLYHIFI